MHACYIQPARLLHACYFLAACPVYVTCAVIPICVQLAFCLCRNSYAVNTCSTHAYSNHVTCLSWHICTSNTNTIPCKANYNSLLMTWQMSDQTKGWSDISKCWQDITLWIHARILSCCILPRAYSFDSTVQCTLSSIPRQLDHRSAVATTKYLQHNHAMDKEIGLKYSSSQIKVYAAQTYYLCR